MKQGHGFRSHIMNAIKSVIVKRLAPHTAQKREEGRLPISSILSPDDQTLAFGHAHSNNKYI
ncbi:hypothetical protein M378DRAFT_168542 [Amanita muscaria Koide BX008]|uniref:Uncharacterized protein n=1 Tax=Amanita muscaria (strain Koide BX008) TaxID=946122 RepID=A0A0C2T0V6_AMAMK|nr:hypothetical protein M378DRAFT_168542 [Amanita muscaria Koide BX008]